VSTFPIFNTILSYSAAEAAATAASASNANLVGDPIELAAIKGAYLPAVVDYPRK